MQLGRYQVLKQLATGSIADVLLARASGLEGFARHVVIKRIHPELAREQRFVDAFLEEARISASLHHQHIVQVHDIGDEGGAIYFAMEYVHGEDCRKVLNRVRDREEQMPLQHVVSIVMATAAGLHYAHEQTTQSGESKGIVHRDIAPANILIGYDGSVKLVDFGLAKAAQRSTNATSSGTRRGKSSYMSPEQCTGKPLDRRTDTFSLGIVLYELLTAQRLFKGATEFLTMGAIVDGEIPRPSTLRPDVPPALDEIVMRSLSRPVELRYQTAEALRASLEAFGIAHELRTSHKALADYLVSLFGQRQEPWLEDQGPDPAWEEVEATHAGLVAVPRNKQDLMHRLSTGAGAESPVRLAQAADDEWAPPTDPTMQRKLQPTLVNPNVRPRVIAPRNAENFEDTTAVRPPAAKAASAKFDEATGVTTEADPSKSLADTITVSPTTMKFVLEGAPGPDARDGDDDDDDHGLDDDESATEIALTVPDYVQEVVVKTKVPTPMRQPSRVVAPVSTALPPVPTAGFGAVGVREVRPPSSPLTPAPTAGLGSVGVREVRPPTPTPTPMPMNPSAMRSTTPGAFAGVAPTTVPSGSQRSRSNADPTFQGLQIPNEAQLGLRTGRRPLVIIGVGVTLVVAGLLMIRACSGDTATAPAAAPIDAEVELDAAQSPVDAATATTDAGVSDTRPVRDAGVSAAPSKRPAPKRPPLRRPKAK